MNLQIDGNAALITTSSSGLGKASAKALAREGVNVVINGRNEKRLADAAMEIREVATGEDSTSGRFVDSFFEFLFLFSGIFRFLPDR